MVIAAKYKVETSGFDYVSSTSKNEEDTKRFALNSFDCSFVNFTKL